MKILVAGLGSIGARHLNNLLTLGVPEAAAFRVRNNPPPASMPPDIKIYSDYDAALEEGFDAVVIANPTSLHVPYARKALLKGCHVYIEKPVSHTLKGTAELLELARKKGKKVTVGCMLRFHENLIQVRKWILSGAAGKIFSVFSDLGEYLPDWHPWEDYRQSYAARQELGGGVILTMIHEIDYLYWLFGGMEEIACLGGHMTPLEIDVEDTALISMKTKGGVLIQLRMDYWRKPPVRKLHIVAEKGEIFWDYFSGEAVFLKNGSVAERSKLPEKWERNHMFLAIMKNFIEVIRGGGANISPLDDGIETLKTALAAKESIKKGRIIRL